MYNDVLLEEPESKDEERKIILGMARRMSDLETKLKSVQNDLSTALNELHRKDSEIQFLKNQLVKTGINYNKETYRQGVANICDDLSEGISKGWLRMVTSEEQVEPIHQKNEKIDYKNKYVAEMAKALQEVDDEEPSILNNHENSVNYAQANENSLRTRSFMADWVKQQKNTKRNNKKLTTKNNKNVLSSTTNTRHVSDINMSEPAITASDVPSSSESLNFKNQKKFSNKSLDNRSLDKNSAAVISSWLTPNNRVYSEMMMWEPINNETSTGKPEVMTTIIREESHSSTQSNNLTSSHNDNNISLNQKAENLKNITDKRIHKRTVQKDVKALDNNELKVLSNEKSFSEVPKEFLVSEVDRLTNQLSEMEKFLSDYGLIWVGESKYVDDEGERNVPTTIGISPNFDKIFMIIGEMNKVTSSESVMNVSAQAGNFEKAKILKLILYADGMQLEDNDFRAYDTDSVKAFFEDLEDGYFPTELKDTYPEGVIFHIVDKREEVHSCTTTKPVKAFTGKGHRLGSIHDSSGKNEDSEEVTREKVKRKPIAKKYTSHPKSSDEMSSAEITINVHTKGTKHPKPKPTERRESLNERISTQSLSTTKEDSSDKGGKRNPPESEKISQERVSNPSVLATVEDIGNMNKKQSHESQNISSKRESTHSIPEHSKPIENEVKFKRLSFSETPSEKQTTSPKNPDLTKSSQTSDINISPCQEQKTKNESCMKISITNITYNEAPLNIGGSEGVGWHKKGCPLDKHCCCESMEQEIQNSNRGNDPSCCILPKYEYNDSEREDSIPKRRSFKQGISEYSEFYDEGAKDVYKEVQKKQPKKTSQAIDTSVKYEHFSFLGLRDEPNISTSEPKEIGSSEPKESTSITDTPALVKSEHLSNSNLDNKRSSDINSDNTDDVPAGIVESPSASMIDVRPAAITVEDVTSLISGKTL